MKLLVVILLLTVSVPLWAQEAFIARCNYYLNDGNLSETSIYTEQISWLKTRFQTSDCTKIANYLKNLISFNQIIPIFQYEPWAEDNDVPFKPIQLNGSSLYGLADEKAWFRHRESFKHLDLFSEFKNLTHINHDPISKEEIRDFCQVLEDVPSVKSVSIRYSGTIPNIWSLKDKEVDCLISNKINVYILGEFTPDEISERLRNNILGIENFLGDIRTLYKYQNLNYLGLLNYKGTTSLRVLTGIKSLTHLHINLGNLESPDEIRHLKYLHYLSANCKMGTNPPNSCELSSLKDIGFIKEFKLLKGLDLSWNFIEDVSPIKSLSKLRHLRLRMNRIKSIQALEALKDLTYLDISANEISDIEHLKHLSEIKFLDISSNHISNIKPLSSLSKLKYLAAGNNSYQLKDFNPSKKLKVLNLNKDHYITSPSLSYLKHMISPSFESSDEHGWTRTILLSHANENSRLKDPYNLVRVSPNDLTIFTNLEYLSIKNNELAVFPKLESLTNLKYLNISENDFKDLLHFDSIPQTIEFFLARNSTLQSALPISNLYQLRYLDLSVNNLQDTKLNIRSTVLTDLILTQCNLLILPNLENSPNIQRLYLGHNALTNFQGSNLQNLRLLYLNHNQIQVLPDFSSNNLLSFISMSSNLITATEGLHHFSLLKRDPLLDEYPLIIRLDLSHNSIDDLSLFKKPDFNYLNLNLENNPILPNSSLCPKDSPNESVSRFCNLP